MLGHLAAFFLHHCNELNVGVGNAQESELAVDLAHAVCCLRLTQTAPACLVPMTLCFCGRGSTVKSDPSYSFEFNEMARPA
jgi:hypothetical protein